eukprot:403356405
MEQIEILNQEPLVQDSSTDLQTAPISQIKLDPEFKPTDQSLNFLTHINSLRTTPRSLIPHMETLLQTLDDGIIDYYDSAEMMLEDGTNCIKEALNFLKDQQELVIKLNWSEVIYWDRLVKQWLKIWDPKGFIRWKLPLAPEKNQQVLASIVTCQTQALDMLSVLILCDGEETRQDRLNIFCEQVTKFGCYTGYHKEHKMITFIMYQ